MFRPEKQKSDEPRPGAVSFDTEDSVVIVEQTVSPFLVLFHEPNGFRAEQIRGLRNKLIAMNPDDSAKTLVVTSANEQEGKTTTAINLAMAFAERDRTPVVLVDADMRKPAVESQLQLNRGIGLSEVLLGSATLEQAIRPAGVRNLDVLGAGARLAVPSEILTTHKIEELYHRLKERYQYVIVDTPAVKPVTDATVLSACADGTLFVTRLLQTSRSQAKEAVRTLRELGANMLGVFVTAVRGENVRTYSDSAWEGD
ncbi:MAG: CpsD/CapB family tyrosine-protein kinase [Planctomycetes bacterium]|nr:CpsD/CapB family tyrosine-protein kinase [Planctomycetota bacterium]MCB9870845.1 CpsD/CapB family tyrosine-protein kinase [Planctomycetota bacterium]